MPAERFVVPSILQMDIEQLRGLCNGLIGIATFDNTLSDRVKANIGKLKNPLMRADIEYALKLLHEPVISRDMQATRKAFLRS